MKKSHRRNFNMKFSDKSFNLNHLFLHSHEDDCVVLKRQILTNRVHILSENFKTYTKIHYKFLLRGISMFSKT